MVSLKAADLQLCAALPTANLVEFITPSPYIEDIVEASAPPPVCT